MILLISLMIANFATPVPTNFATRDNTFILYLLNQRASHIQLYLSQTNGLVVLAFLNLFSRTRFRADTYITTLLKWMSGNIIFFEVVKYFYPIPIEHGMKSYCIMRR